MKNKTIDKEFEKVEAIGSDNEKTGIAATKEILLEEEKERKNKNLLELEYLDNFRKKKVVYIQSLAKLLLVRLYEDEFPLDVSYEVVPTDIGIIMELSIKDRLFRQAFQVLGDPKYDLNAVDVFVLRAENTVEEIKKQYEKLYGRN